MCSNLCHWQKKNLLLRPTAKDSAALAAPFELRQAVDAYLFDSSEQTSVAATYGWPIGQWCVGEIENFDALFSIFRNRRAVTFNEDLSGWNMTKASSMNRMFLFARDFDQDLCAWGDVLDLSKRVSMNYMLRGTSCPTKVPPSYLEGLEGVPNGPFCHYCFAREATVTPSAAPITVPSAAPSAVHSAAPSAVPSTSAAPSSQYTRACLESRSIEQYLVDRLMNITDAALLSDPTSAQGMALNFMSSDPMVQFFPCTYSYH